MKKISLIIICIFVAFLGTAQTKKTNNKKQTPTHTTVTAPLKKDAKNQHVEISTELGSMIIKLYDETPLHRDNFIKLVNEGFYDSLLFHRVIKSFMIQGGDPTSKNASPETMLGAGDNGYKIMPEFRPDIFHKRGSLAAARDNNPQQMSSGCQFYIVQGRKYTSQELEQIINNRNLQRKQELLYKVYQSDSVQATVSSLQNTGDKEVIRAYMDKIHANIDETYKRLYPNADKVNLDQMQTYMEYGGAPHLDGAYTVFGEMVSGFDVLDKIASTATKPGDRPIADIRMKIRLVKQP
ncbi:MAG: peptidylprolyl isomerase [Sphingobacteriales bacterium]|jgi:peptidylprolyl isomerase/peptidyl-prolyl cis-trans isomerase B (cyclophilin B)|nr:peptidylprolyl isomerase [Sphingobacteriales bacterium]